ncbi:MAG: porin [Paludibacteraceae bacterium]
MQLFGKYKVIIGLLIAGSTTLLGSTPTDSIKQYLPFDIANAGLPDIDEGKALEGKKMAKSDYIPEIHGTVRGRYEYCTTLDSHRFMVRNARISITGNVHPLVAYKAEIDLSDQGKTKMLDAYVRVFPVKGMSLTLGQMKVPFSTDNLRSPHNQYFINRTFLAKEITGLRDVGFSVGYELKEKFPFSVIAGIYNGLGLYNQTVWHKTMCYSARATFDPCDYINFSLNFQSFDPDSIRMNVYDIGLFSEFHNVHIEAEYLYKTYQNPIFKPTHAVSTFINYDLMLPKVFNKLSFLARYDWMSENYEGFDDILDNFLNTDAERHRITTGITLSLSKPFLVDLRINYEKYFYNDWSLAEADKQDKVTLEMVVRF